MTNPVSLKVDATDVIKKIEKALDLTANFKPLFLQIIGKPNDSNPFTIRGSALKAFITKTNPDNNFPWAPLSYDYMVRKQKKYSGKPTLVASGDLFDSVVTRGDVQIINDRNFAYGTAVSYAKYHQSNAPRTSLPRRAFLGWRKGQKQAVQRLVSAYVRQAFGAEMPEGGPT